jgi:hypothetical protein
VAFSGGDYAEVGRWLANFAVSHAKREHPRIEAVVDAEGEREGRSYGIQLRLGARVLPAPDDPPFELSYPEVSQSRGSLAWCADLAGRVRAPARRLAEAERGVRTSA